MISRALVDENGNRVQTRNYPDRDSLRNGNNPLVFVDPDGEWIQFVIGAMINVILNAPNINDWEDFLGYAAIGAFGAGIGMFGTPANWALNTAIGSVQGGIVQGLNSSLTARSWDAFGSGFKSGKV